MTSLPDDCATARLRLAEAELALHQLQTGSRAQSLAFGPGKSVTYTQTNIRELQAYVNTLRDKVAACEGRSARGRGPVRFVF